MFVFVIMVISASRPILQFVSDAVRRLALVVPLPAAVAYYFLALSAVPLLGSIVTEPAAMTLGALMLRDVIFSRQASNRLKYLTLGVLFVNVSIGGTLTNFAAPPILMVTAPWGWDTAHMLRHFGWIAVVGILVCNALYFLVFRREFARLAPSPDPEGGEKTDRRPVPPMITVIHLLFMAAAVYNVHRPALLVGSFLFFMAFFEVTEDHQDPLQLRSPILVGFFLAGLVIHGGLQKWWIAPVLGGLQELPLMFGAIGLTAVNDNAAITFLATLVPNLSEPMKYAVVAGAVIGGGLTVIANAPNPAGQAILGDHFDEGISPLGLLLGALPPTAVMAACFLLFGGG
jgi:Na+/H+ antiporter NhaD/arsenite permease-like protein